MNGQIVRVLLAFFPRSWRARYGEEFASFLHDSPLTLFAVVDTTICAFNQHLGAFGKVPMLNAHRSFLFVAYACAAAFAGAVNLYWILDDTPFGPAMSGHTLWTTAWNMVPIGSLLILLAGTACALPVVSKLFLAARKAKRSDILLFLAFTPASAALVLVWLILVSALSPGHWLPTPWDILGHWTAPENWPSLPARWTLGSISLVLMLVVLVGGSLSLKRALKLSSNLVQPPSPNHIPLAKASARALTGASAVMTIAVVIWCGLANTYAPTALHERFGGFMNSTTLASCLGSSVLFAAAAAMGFRSTRWINAADAV
jgi:hypothetical protein